HSKSRIFALATGCVVLALTAASQNQGFRDWKCVSETPVLSPSESGFESSGTFNPAVIRRGDKFVMLYRAQDASGTSRLGYAESTNGVHLTKRFGAVLAPEAEYEKGGGVEDPRRIELGGRCYLACTVYNRKD